MLHLIPWLNSVSIPQKPFMLFPWARVTDPRALVEALKVDVLHPKGWRYVPAMQEIERMYELYGKEQEFEPEETEFTMEN
jgi:hypothetical protein